KAASATAAGIFYNQGQVCIAGTRLLLEESIADEFLALLKQQAQNWQPGHPLDPATTMGTLIDCAHADSVHSFIREGESKGQLLLDGRNAELAAAIGPTIFVEVDPNASLSREEIFGPVLVVTRFWNFPLLLTCWKLGPALAAGNSVILKPSEKSPLSAIRLAGLAKEAGLPDGVLNVVTGFGHEAGQALSRHNDIDAIAFTGSTRTGKQLLKDAGDSNMKRVWLEAGGKSANIVFADCPDLQ
ncbi:aldehyde dehydrogenase family protein, partial [Escherichia coli]